MFSTKIEYDLKLHKSVAYRVLTQYVKEAEKCLEKLPTLGACCLVLVHGEVSGKYAAAECFVLRA